ncbi:hypothetical protein Tco_0748073 [Tanacetum coccineum]|uniref:Uncharacterized protein n=1 Tax=Tanacetum coccineum TaxID=301880 RepID=A0ABQ4YXA4_9ASTR
MDDEPMWAADRGVASTPDSVITIPETANEFAIKVTPSTKSNGHNSKAYQPPHSPNEHVNAVFTRSGKSYNPPINRNEQQDNSETPVNFDSDDKDEPTPQPKTQDPKPVKETPLPKLYKPKIPYPQRLRKEKMEA